MYVLTKKPPRGWFRFPSISWEEMTYCYGIRCHYPSSFRQRHLTTSPGSFTHRMRTTSGSGVYPFEISAPMGISVPFTSYTYISIYVCSKPSILPCYSVIVPLCSYVMAAFVPYCLSLFGYPHKNVQPSLLTAFYIKLR